MRKLVIVSLLFILIIHNELFSQENMEKEKKNEFKFRIGLNYAVTFGNPEFKGGYIGFGLFLEPMLSQNTSIVITYNSFNLSAKNSSAIHSDVTNINSSESAIILRYRIPGRKLTFLSQIGFGRIWNDVGGFFLLAPGVEYKFNEKYFVSVLTDFYSIGSGTDLAGGGWSSNLIKVNFNFTVMIIYDLLN